MAHLLFYCPGVQMLTPPDAARLGISHVLAGEHSSGSANGPEGLGAVVSIGSPVMEPAKQDWSKVGEGLWIGKWKDQPLPTPAELAKPKQLAGEVVTLGGQQWTMPRAILFTDASRAPSLPTQLKIDERGEWTVGGVLPEFQSYWDAADKLMQHLVSAGESEFGVLDLVDLVVMGLSINYRVSKFELAELGVVTLLDDAMMAAGKVAAGWSLFVEIAKKKYPPA